MGFGKEYIYSELKKVDNALDKVIKLYLIGGGNMSLFGLKDATRDIDIILNEKDEMTILKDALLECGYEKKYLPAYQKMGSRLVMENKMDLDGMCS